MTSELLAIHEMIERGKIIDVIVGIANAMDDKNWQKLKKYLADEINIDYSEFRGEPPQRITAEAYVQQRVEGLTGLKTLHISTNHEVLVRKEYAQCRSAYRIYRFDPTRKHEQERLDTAGNYDHQLIQVEGEWRVTAIKQTVVIMTGNRQVHGGLRNP
ncbi:nuclear transport factor 2 family protein [Phormidesmis sp. 146-12]